MKKKTVKPRNPFVQHLVKRKQGAHTTSNKQRRIAERMALKKQIKSDS